MKTLECLYLEWFSNTHWWFNASKTEDEYISSTYVHLLDVITNIHEIGYENILASVILYDQVPRHIFRGTLSAHIIDFYNIKACEVASLMLTKYPNVKACHWCFIMLPFRHTNNLHTVLDVIKRTWIKIEESSIPEDISQLKQYIKASYNRCPYGDLSLINTYTNTQICDGWDMFKSITVDAPHRPDNFQNTDSFVNKFDLEVTCSDIIISLSGGVDSMVASYILSKLCNQNGRTKFNLHAVHINYSNRDTCALEEKMVTTWCSHIGVTCHVRRIQEINRPQCMMHELRDLYENYTRNVRYATYKNVWDKLGAPKTQPPMVVLGHNKDDCFENILTNIVQQNKYDNLLGMSKSGLQDGIMFLRPMLDISKTDIVKFATRLGIPFLQDSTPKWSQRGKIRDTVKPTLESWDHRSIEGLFKMASTMTDMFGLLQNCIKTMLSQSKNDTGCLITLDMPINSIPTKTIVWREYFCKMNIPISKRSLESMCSRLSQVLSKLSDKNTFKIVLSRNHTMSLFKTVGNIHNVTFNIHRCS